MTETAEYAELAFNHHFYTSLSTGTLSQRVAVKHKPVEDQLCIHIGGCCYISIHREDWHALAATVEQVIATSEPVNEVTFIDPDSGEEYTCDFRSRAAADAFIDVCRSNDVPAWHVHHGILPARAH